MVRYADFLLSLILPICLNVAQARALDEAELATLRADKQGPSQQYAARALARTARERGQAFLRVLE